DERRVYGMKTLSDIDFAGDAKSVERAIAALEPFIADAGDDNVRANALLSAVEVLKKETDAPTPPRLIEAATTPPGVHTLHALARIACYNGSLLGPDTHGKARSRAPRTGTSASRRRRGTAHRAVRSILGGSSRDEAIFRRCPPRFLPRLRYRPFQS